MITAKLVKRFKDGKDGIARNCRFVSSVLLLVMFIYTVLGMSLFPFVMLGEAYNEQVNFRSIGATFLLLFQVNGRRARADARGTRATLPPPSTAGS